MFIASHPGRLYFNTSIPAMLLIALLFSGSIATAQHPNGKAIDTPASVTAPVPIALSADDQQLLDRLIAQIEELRPNLEAVQKQRDDARSLLAQAEAFLAKYNQWFANRQVFARLG